MKLSDWAKKQGIAYLTAYRWFKDGKLPVKAYQSDSGTIIVQDESENLEQAMGSAQPTDVMTAFFLKTVEFSKNNRTIEEFAAWVMSTFTLKFNNVPENPRYSRVKPKPEEVQKHFQQFLKPKGDKPKPNMFVAPPEALEEIAEQEQWSLVDGEGLRKTSDTLDVQLSETSDVVSVPELTETFGELLMTPASSTVKTYSSVAEGVVNRSVDSTPQLNYTGSNSLASSNYFQTSTNLAMPAAAATVINNAYYVGEDTRLGVAPVYPGGFKPTQKELESASKALEVTERPRRGRKPSKNSKKV
jgi:hypothetical protein